MSTTLKLRWVKIPADAVPGTTVPLAMREVWRSTGMGYVKEMAQPDFFKLQLGTPNDKGEVIWTDVEIGVEAATVTTRFIGGKAVRSEN